MESSLCFAIAGVVKVETAKDGKKSAFVMKLDDIRKLVGQSSGEQTYNPPAVDTKDIDFEKGTRITLTDLRKKKTIRTNNSLRRRLARRFSIIGPGNSFHCQRQRRGDHPFRQGLLS